MIARYNITMDTRLHDAGVDYARNVLYCDFSGLLASLLVQELKKQPTTAPTPTPTITPTESAIARFTEAKAKNQNAHPIRKKRAK